MCLRRRRHEYRINHLVICGDLYLTVRCSAQQTNIIVFVSKLTIDSILYFMLTTRIGKTLWDNETDLTPLVTIILHKACRLPEAFASIY